MLKSLRKWQVGLEDSPGVEVDASDRLLGDLTVSDASETVTPEADYGHMDAVIESPVLVLEGTELSWTTDLSFEQILYALLCGIKGGETPSEVNPGEGDYQWDFVPVASAKPVVDSLTLEYVETDGAAVTEEWTATNMLCSEIEVSWEGGSSLAQMVSSWFATGIVNKAAAAAVAKPARTLIPGKKVTVAFADSFANLVGASARSDVLSGSWKLTTGLARKDRADGTLDYADYKADKRAAELSLSVDLGADFETARTRFRAGTETFIRVMVEGAQIGAGEKKTIIIDGCYVIPDWSDFGGDDDNESIIDITYVAKYDATGGKAFSVHVINDQAVLPGALGS
ncbi:hypothetical protein LCGC14_0662760 [marine sediment metagenome]|uniref:Uncharacterized protein n=1 Tax=marine sediment metagenome TaxID=412755 RepID=A0A0F9TEG1_9ZZZZ